MSYNRHVLRVGLAVAAAVSVATLAPAPVAIAHLERPSQFPDPSRGAVPEYRTNGPSLVVCKPDSAARIERLLDGALLRKNLELLRDCRFHHIQAAVDAASNGMRILILPGMYREQPSRDAPVDPDCEALLVPLGVGRLLVPSYAYQQRCPTAQNLIAIIGDSDGDGVCDAKCNLQIEGTGSKPSQVVISGDRAKLNTIRADRADGVFLRNFTVQYSDFNNVYVLETNGFRFDRIVSRWSREYGFLTFTSDHGLYENVVAYGAGDAGIYPGSGPEGHCARYGIEIRNANSYGNVFGLSGNSGNGLWVHDSRFHHNGAGLVVGSLGPGHPGQPQDCSKFERNRIYSNNLDLYSRARDDYCRRPPVERSAARLCPTTPAPLGTGLMILGGNRNLVRANWIYDNWRTGVHLGWAPVRERARTVLGLRTLGLLLEGVGDVVAMPTSHGNRFLGNRMGVRPDGRRASNGLDFTWDREGRRNCWSGNRGLAADAVTSEPRRLPGCPGPSRSIPPTPGTIAELLACAGWTVADRHPRGCSWTTLPEQPSVGSSGSTWTALRVVLVFAILLAAVTAAVLAGRLIRRR